jgi:hypothetical protein
MSFSPLTRLPPVPMDFIAEMFPVAGDPVSGFRWRDDQRD